MSNSEIVKGMKSNFENRINIHNGYEYISDDKLGDILDTEFDGYGYKNQDILIYVDCRGLPTEFGIYVLKIDEGQIEERETHDSTKAAEITNELMERYC